MELVSPELVNVISVIAIITGLVFAGWFVISLYWMRSRQRENELTEADFPAGLREVESGVPPALAIFYACMGFSMVAYVLAVWIAGVSY